MLRIVLLIALLALPVQLEVSAAMEKPLPYHIYGGDRVPFYQSLAEFVSGRVMEHEPGDNENDHTSHSVVWIPTYYGYHSFLGVLDTFISKHTSITSLRTWRLADRNFFVIHLVEDNLSVRIVYDLRNSLLMITTPTGY